MRARSVDLARSMARGVADQALAASDRRTSRARTAPPTAGVISTTDRHGDEVGRAQAAREARGSRGRQDVVGRDPVVAERHRGPRARGSAAPKLRTVPRNASRVARAASSRCSGARSFDDLRGLLEIARRARRGRVAERLVDDLAPPGALQARPRAPHPTFSTTSASRRDEERSEPRGSCSAWAIRSSASERADRRSASATIASSLGPARPSIPTTPATWRLASVTYAFPGPTMPVDRRHRRRSRRPAPPTACAPPDLHDSSWRPPSGRRRGPAAWIEAVGLRRGVQRRSARRRRRPPARPSCRPTRGTPPGRPARRSRRRASGLTTSPDRTPSRSSHHSTGS